MSKSIVILGAGESGIGAAILGQKHGYSVFLSDFGAISEANQEALRALGVDFEEKGHTQERILAADVVVKSPGVPDKAPIVKALLQKGIPVISEIEFAYQHLDEKAKVIAITGTNGKTTTTLLTYHLLKTAGLKVALGGNVGISLAKLVAEGGYDYYVVEVSSFQLDGIVKFKPDVAILLNITPDHLDRYEYDFQKYVASKFRITENLTHEECFIYSADSEPITRELARRQVDACLFALSVMGSQAQAWLENGHLIFNFEFKNQSAKHRIPVSEVSLIGKHNMLNAMAAVLAALAMEVPMADVIRGLKSFVNAPHRLEFCGTLDGVKYINDSKATNVDSVYYALEGIQNPLIWIAGGIDKGNDYTQIQQLVADKVKALISLGVDNAPLTSFFEETVPQILETQQMGEAVTMARELAEPGDVVLLSPACASFDLFKNYEDRGDQFRTAVKKMLESTPESV